VRAWLVLGILSALAACGGVAPAGLPASSSPSPRPSPTATPAGPLETLKLACVGPQSGELAFLGKPSLQACQMAVDEFNTRAGGIQGVTVEVVPGDDAGSAEQATRLAAKLSADRAVLGMVGPMTSAAVLAAGPTFDAAHIAFVSQSASNPKITESGWKTGHRLVARDDAEGSADAEFVFGPPLNAKKAFVVDRHEPYSISLADEFEKRAKALGIKTERGSLTGSPDYAALISRAKAANPDVLFFPDQGSQCAAMLLEMQKQAVSSRLMSSDGCHDKERFIAASQGAAEGMFVSDTGAGYDTTPEGQAWAKDFRAKFGAEPGPFSWYAYDAARIVLQAVDSAAKAKGSLELRPADVNAEIAKIKDFNGLLGPITFNAKGDVENASIAIFQVVGGEFKQVKKVR